MTPSRCPLCGGEKSHFYYPYGNLKQDKDQECLTCGLKVGYWPNVKDLHDVICKMQRQINQGK